MAKVRISASRFNRVVGGMVSDATERAARRTQQRARQNIVRTGRIDSGQMLNGVVVRREPSPPMHPQYSVISTAPHSSYQEFGTRAHGPTHAKALRFKPKGSGVFVFAKRVRGVRAAHFMRDALRAARVTDWFA